MMKKIIAATISASLAACASQPLPTSESKNAPIEQHINSSLFVPSPGSAEVTIKRDDSFGMPCPTRVFIDGAPVADVYKTEKIVIFVKHGDRIISARSIGVCGTGIAEVRTNFKADEKMTFRIGYSKNGEINIAPTAF